MRGRTGEDVGAPPIPCGAAQTAAPAGLVAPVAPARPQALPRGGERLATAFAALGLDPPTVEHDAAFTVDDARALRGTIDGLHTKNLFLKDKKGALFLVTAPEDATIDLKRLHVALGARGRLSFAPRETMVEVLGIEPGSVTPLAVVNDDSGRVTAVFDRAVATATSVNVHPLRNTATTTLAGKALLALMDHFAHAPLVVDLPRPQPAD